MLIKKIPDVNDLVNATVLNTKITTLVKKTDDNVKISDIEKKYFTTSHYNIFSSEILDVKIKEKK